LVDSCTPIEDPALPVMRSFAAAAHPSHQSSHGSAATREGAICTGPRPVVWAPNRPAQAPAGWGCLLGPESCAPKAAGRGRGGFTGGVPTSVSAPPVHLIKLTATQRSRRSNGYMGPPDCGRLRAARNRADSTVEHSENRQSAYRAYTVGSDGHFVGFEPLTWQLHCDHPPPARPPSSAMATPRPR
jgi:hypothetical protein